MKLSEFLGSIGAVLIIIVMSVTEIIRGEN